MIDKKSPVPAQIPVNQEHNKDQNSENAQAKQTVVSPEPGKASQKDSSKRNIVILNQYINQGTVHWIRDLLDSKTYVAKFVFKLMKSRPHHRIFGIASRDSIFENVIDHKEEIERGMIRERTRVESLDKTANASTFNQGKFKAGVGFHAATLGASIRASDDGKHNIMSKSNNNAYSRYHNKVVSVIDGTFGNVRSLPVKKPLDFDSHETLMLSDTDLSVRNKVLYVLGEIYSTYGSGMVIKAKLGNVELNITSDSGRSLMQTDQNNLDVGIEGNAGQLTKADIGAKDDEKRTAKKAFTEHYSVEHTDAGEIRTVTSAYSPEQFYSALGGSHGYRSAQLYELFTSTFENTTELVTQLVNDYSELKKAGEVFKNMRDTSGCHSRKIYRVMTNGKLKHFNMDTFDDLMGSIKTFKKEVLNGLIYDIFKLPFNIYDERFQQRVTSAVQRLTTFRIELRNLGEVNFMRTVSEHRLKLDGRNKDSSEPYTFTDKRHLPIKLDEKVKYAVVVDFGKKGIDLAQIPVSVTLTSHLVGVKPSPTRNIHDKEVTNAHNNKNRISGCYRLSQLYEGGSELANLAQDIAFKDTIDFESIHVSLEIDYASLAWNKWPEICKVINDAEVYDLLHQLGFNEPHYKEQFSPTTYLEIVRNALKIILRNTQFLFDHPNQNTADIFGKYISIYVSNNANREEVIKTMQEKARALCVVERKLENLIDTYCTNEYINAPIDVLLQKISALNFTKLLPASNLTERVNQLLVSVKNSMDAVTHSNAVVQEVELVSVNSTSASRDQTRLEAQPAPSMPRSDLKTSKGKGEIYPADESNNMKKNPRPIPQPKLDPAPAPALKPLQPRKTVSFPGQIRCSFNFNITPDSRATVEDVHRDSNRQQIVF